ncbi:MAG TPA: hypothetical protein VF215_11670 [Thermoanaerobaculia bacterium]
MIFRIRNAGGMMSDASRPFVHGVVRELANLDHPLAAARLDHAEFLGLDGFIQARACPPEHARGLVERDPLLVM